MKILFLWLFLISLPAFSAGIKTPFGVKFSKSKVTKASFEMTWERYPTPDMILNYMASSFPLNSTFSGDECLTLNEANRALLGDNNPLLGAPVINKPNSSFVVWYVGCLQSMLKSERTVIMGGKPSNEQQAMIQAYLGANPANICMQVTTQTSSCLWSFFSEAEKKQKIKNQILSFVGPNDVIRDLGIAQSSDELADKILSEISDSINKKDGRYTFIDSSKELTLLDATQITKFLLMILDTLKY
jgi:hypothetical protein